MVQKQIQILPYLTSSGEDRQATHDETTRYAKVARFTLKPSPSTLIRNYEVAAHLYPQHLGGRELPFCFVCLRVFFFFVLRSF
jgi:hypothetical protein